MVVSSAPAVGLQSELPLLVVTVRRWAPPSEEQWVLWAALSLLHHRLGTATNTELS